MRDNREGHPEFPDGPCGQCGWVLRRAGVSEDVKPIVAVRRGDVLLAVRPGEDLNAPEVVATLIDVVADLDERVVDDLGYAEAGRVGREVGQGGSLLRGRYIVHAEVAESRRERGVVRLGDRVRVQLSHLAVAVAEQVHVAPAVEVR